MNRRFYLFMLLPVWLAAGCRNVVPTPLAEPSTPEDRALVVSVAPDYYHRGKNTPAEFVTNTLSVGEPKKAVYLLMPERFSKEYIAFGYSRDAARRVIEQYRKDADRGFAWTVKNRELTIPFGTPAVDGEIGTAEWRLAAVLNGEMPLDTAAVVPAGNAVWRVMYDREHLYFSVFFPDRDIRVANQLYDGDSLELFVMSDPAMRTYWEVIVAPDGRRFCAWHMANDHGGFTSRLNIQPEKLRTAARKFSDGYAVEIALPFSALPTLGRPLPYPGAVISFMMVRTNRDGVDYRRTVPVPLLYDGHNFAGYLHGTLK